MSHDAVDFYCKTHGRVNVCFPGASHEWVVATDLAIPTPAPVQRQENSVPEAEDTGAVDPRAEILDEAKRIVTADRANAYGPPEDNFRRIADLWTEYVSEIWKKREYFKAEDVAVMMILMKVARLIETPGHKDSWQDIAGYSACGWSTVA